MQLPLCGVVIAFLLHTSLASGKMALSRRAAVAPYRNLAFPGKDWYDHRPSESDSNARGCPRWLSSYVEFHQQNKGKPGARYMVYYCHELDCIFGIGDRMRGIMYLLRAAAASNRLLLLDITYPIALEEMFIPSAIDWSMGDLRIPENAVWWHDKDRVEWNATDVTSYFIPERAGWVASNHAANVTADWLAVQGLNTYQFDDIVGGPAIGWWGQGSHCMSRALFKPSIGVQKTMLDMLRQMGLRGKPYVALHLRLGGMVGEGRIERFDAMAGLHSGLNCARQAAAKRGIPENQPVVIITDNLELKALLTEGLLKYAVTTNSIPVHIGLATHLNFTKNTFHQTIADMGILAGSTCMVADKGGGFALQARFWGGPTLWHWSDNCFQTIQQCIIDGGAMKAALGGVLAPNRTLGSTGTL